jgi:hypothetical protein
MPRHMARIRTLAAIGLIALIPTAAACGGNGDNDVDDASRTTTNEAPLNQDTPSGNSADEQPGMAPGAETTPSQ